MAVTRDVALAFVFSVKKEFLEAHLGYGRRPKPEDFESSDQDARERCEETLELVRECLDCLSACLQGQPLQGKLDLPEGKAARATKAKEEAPEGQGEEMRDDPESWLGREPERAHGAAEGLPGVDIAPAKKRRGRPPKAKAPPKVGSPFPPLKGSAGGRVTPAKAARGSVLPLPRLPGKRV